MNHRGRAAMLGAAVLAAWAAATPAKATAVSTSISGSASTLVAGSASQRRPTFASDIAPIVYAHCTPCHRIGQPAPFSLLSYEEVRDKGADVAAATSARRMPPWHATPQKDFPALLDDRRLTDKQIAAIKTWVARGMPAGNSRDLPRPPAFSSAPWPLGQPDVTLTLPRSFVIAAGDTDEYHNVVIPLDFPADIAISAIDYLPGDRSVLRHARFFAAPQGLTVRDEDALPGVGGLLGTGSLENYGDQVLAAASRLVDLGGWTPGFARMQLPGDLGLRLPARSVLVVHMQLHAGDVDAVEDGRVGLYFAKAGARRVVPLSVPPAFGIATRLSVPAGDAAFVLTDSFTLPIDVDAVGARGYAQRLGHDLTLTSAPPSGAAKGLLRIGQWDPEWPETYLFATPMHLVKGTTLRADIRYDNSDANPRNLFSPPRRIGWGRMSSGEMGAMTLLITAPTPAAAAVLDAAVAQHVRDQLLQIRSVALHALHGFM